MHRSLRLPIAFLLMSTAAPLLSPQTAKQSAAPPSATMPSRISMCEDSDGCSNWSFEGDQGNGTWASRSDADLTITHLDATSITIHREDHRGITAGLSADYTGAISNHWIEGTVDASWPGHVPATGHTGWRGIIFPSQAVWSTSEERFDAGRAHAMAWGVCEDVGDRCNVPKPPTTYMWMLTGTVGIVHLLNDGTTNSHLSVDALPDKSVLARRYDDSGPFAGASLLYVGQWEGDLLSGTFRWIWPGHNAKVLQGTWLAKRILDQCGPNLEVTQNVLASTAAYLRNDKSSDFSCLLEAARQGDTNSENILGVDYMTGSATPQDYQLARDWLIKAADQGSSEACHNLSVLYRKGLGVPTDLFIARYFADKGALLKAETTSETTLMGFAQNIAEKRLRSQLVNHEESVISSMKDGKSRVEAEDAFFKKLKINAFVDSVRDGDPCGEMPFASGLSREDRERAQESHSDCESREGAKNQAIWSAASSYLACVHQYVDSNSIEPHCDYNPP
jgi:hypothetical protein